MTLPRDLAEIAAMGRAFLQPCVEFYAALWGLGSWAISALWVEAVNDDGGAPLPGVVGACWPDPTYRRARIEIVWPPAGDVEETIAHEVAHAKSAHLALLAGAAPGTEARLAWEHLAEEDARGAVDLRRHGERRSRVVAAARAVRRVVACRRSGDAQILARVARAATSALRAGRNSTVDKTLIQEALDVIASGDAEKAMQILKDLIASEVAGGDVDVEPTMATEEPTPSPPMRRAPNAGRAVDVVVAANLAAARRDTEDAARLGKMARDLAIKQARLALFDSGKDVLSPAHRTLFKDSEPEEIQRVISALRMQREQGQPGGVAAAHREAPPGGGAAANNTRVRVNPATPRK